MPRKSFRLNIIFRLKGCRFLIVFSKLGSYKVVFSHKGRLSLHLNLEFLPCNKSGAVQINIVVIKALVFGIANTANQNLIRYLVPGNPCIGLTFIP